MQWIMLILEEDYFFESSFFLTYFFVQFTIFLLFFWKHVLCVFGLFGRQLIIIIINSLNIV